MHRVAIMLAITLTLCGCYSYKPIYVTVLSATDGKPISGVELTAGPQLRKLEHTFVDYGPYVTDSNGFARVRCVSDWKSRPISLGLGDGFVLESGLYGLNLPRNRIRESSDRQPYEITLRVLTKEENQAKHPERYLPFSWG